MPFISIAKGSVWTHKMVSTLHLESTEGQIFARIAHPIRWRGSGSQSSHLQCPNEECASAMTPTEVTVLAWTPSGWDSQGRAGAWEWDVPGKIQTAVFPKGPSQEDPPRNQTQLSSIPFTLLPLNSVQEGPKGYTGEREAIKKKQRILLLKKKNFKVVLS